jgi:hypothetical protein
MVIFVFMVCLNKQCCVIFVESEKYELTRSIFTIPDQDDKNGMFSTTRFGQNIGANRKSVAIMVR